MADPPGASGELRARQPKAIHSALTVLEEVARAGAGVTAREVSEGLGLPRATTYRLLNLLVQDEYLVRMPDLRGFALGRKVAELVGSVAPSRPPQAAREVIAELRQRICGGVHVVRYGDDSISIVDSDPDFPLNDELRVLREFDASAIGLLLLAEQRSLGRASARTAHAGRGIDDDLAAALARGYSSQIGRFVPGFGCIGVPIRDSSGLLVAGLCFSGPRTRIESPERIVAELANSGRSLAPLLA